jgi:RNA polymerase sigma factor (sigma-70 family)
LTKAQAKQLLADRWSDLLRVAARVLRAGGHAEPQDAAQDACCKALHAIEAGSYPREHDHLFAWFMCIASNAALDLMRRQKRYTKRVSGELDNDPADNLPGPGEQTLAQERVERLRSSLERLPHEEQQLVRLRCGGMPDRQIATVLGIPAGSVSLGFRRAHARFRRLLGTG